MAYDRFKLLTDPERYHVSYGDIDEKSKETFASWIDALKFSRKTAAESGRRVFINDFAKYEIAPFTGEPSYVMYIVSPSGEVYRETHEGLVRILSSLVP